MPDGLTVRAAVPGPIRCWADRASTVASPPHTHIPAIDGRGHRRVYRGPVHLAAMLRQSVVARTGNEVGRVDDVAVRLREGDYPLVVGLVALVGRRQIFIPAHRLEVLDEDRVVLSGNKVNLRAFERRDGEVLLREDILGHRLINVADAELVRAYDVELRRSGALAAAGGAGEWTLSCLDTRRPHHWWNRSPRTSAGEQENPGCVDWKAFEPLVGHTPSALLRSGPRLRRLKPAQIADLLEAADKTEGAEILSQVHADPELEADVFEELEPDLASRLLRAKTDDDLASVLARMRADDAADAIADLPQDRRRPVLDRLPAPQRTKILTLMGFGESTAGGLMNLDLFAADGDSTVAEALAALRQAHATQPEALNTVHILARDPVRGADDSVLESAGRHVASAPRLAATVTLVRLLQSDSADRLAAVADHDPVRVTPGTDIEDVALLMADYNLVTIPVVDDHDGLLGVITVDDVLEATIPEEWRRREPPARPGHRATASA